MLKIFFQHKKSLEAKFKEEINSLRAEIALKNEQIRQIKASHLTQETNLINLEKEKNKELELIKIEMGALEVFYYL